MKKHIVFNSIPILVFIIGIFVALFWEYNSTNITTITPNLTYDKCLLFKKIASNNYMVCLLLILGFITFGLSSIIMILYNGFIFGICLQSLPIDKLVYHFLSYSILESIGFIISCQIAISISSKFYMSLFSKEKKHIDLNKLVRKIFLTAILILTAAIIEVYVSIS